MSFARAISRGFFLKARLGVNGTKNASRSFGPVGASGRAASDISSPLQAAFWSPAPLYQPIGVRGMPGRESVVGEARISHGGGRSRQIDQAKIVDCSRLI